jgi:hypothetical protein
MKFEFDLERYWKPAIIILAIAFLIMLFEPYAIYNVIVLGLSCMMTISIYKHYTEAPVVTKPKKKNHKKKAVIQDAET